LINLKRKPTDKAHAPVMEHLKNTEKKKGRRKPRLLMIPILKAPSINETLGRKEKKKGGKKKVEIFISLSARVVASPADVLRTS
jgi:hypothetical protein